MKLSFGKSYVRLQKYLHQTHVIVVQIRYMKSIEPYQFMLYKKHHSKQSLSQIV